MTSRRLWKTQILEKLKVDTFGQVTRPVHRDPPGLKIAVRENQSEDRSDDRLRYLSDSDCSPDKTSSGEDSGERRQRSNSGEGRRSLEERCNSRERRRLQDSVERRHRSDSGERRRSPKLGLSSPPAFVPPDRRELGQSALDFIDDDDDFTVDDLGEAEGGPWPVLNMQAGPAWRCASGPRTLSTLSEFPSAPRKNTPSESSSTFTSAASSGGSQELSGPEVEQETASASQGPEDSEKRGSGCSTAYSPSASNCGFLSEGSDTHRISTILAGKAEQRRVSFGPADSDIVYQSEHNVPAYCEIYGEHPSLFEFDVDGNKIPVPDERVPVFRFPSQKQWAPSYNLRSKAGRQT